MRVLHILMELLEDGLLLSIIWYRMVILHTCVSVLRVWGDIFVCLIFGLLWWEYVLCLTAPVGVMYRTTP